MRHFLFALLVLLSISPARAATTAAVFKCTPDDFTLQRNGTGFVLTGEVSTLAPGYTYSISPVTGTGDGRGEATVTLAPPGKAAPRDINKLRIGRSFLSEAWPVSHLTIHFDDPNGLAPASVDCIQLGGSQ